jgi:hypothetical protein
MHTGCVHEILQKDKDTLISWVLNLPSHTLPEEVF